MVRKFLVTGIKTKIHIVDKNGEKITYLKATAIRKNIYQGMSDKYIRCYKCKKTWHDQPHYWVFTKTATWELLLYYQLSVSQARRHLFCAIYNFSASSSFFSSFLSFSLLQQNHKSQKKKKNLKSKVKMKRRTEKIHIETIRFNWTYLWLTENDIAHNERGKTLLISIFSHRGQI